MGVSAIIIMPKEAIYAQILPKAKPLSLPLLPRISIIVISIKSPSQGINKETLGEKEKGEMMLLLLLLLVQKELLFLRKGTHVR